VFVNKLHYLLFVILVLFITLIPESSRAATYLVNSFGDTRDISPGNGFCSDGSSQVAKCTLRAAIEEANANTASNDTISLPPGTYQLTLGTLEISSTIFLNGHGTTPAETIINGSDQDRVLHVYSAVRTTVLIKNLTITNGQVNANGAGVYVKYKYPEANGSAFTLNNVVVTNNTAWGAGGGIYFEGCGSALNVALSTISNNHAKGRQFSNQPLIADDGGGISLYCGSVTIFNSSLTGNTALGNGGGLSKSTDVVAQYTNMFIINSTIDNNSATDGGGIYLNKAALTLMTSTVSTNTASNQGGGIYLYNIEQVNIDAVTITKNSAGGTPGGGGIFYTDQNAALGKVALQQTILAGNQAQFGPDCSGGPSYRLMAFNILGNKANCNIGGTNGVNGNQIGTANAPIDPMLSSLQDNGGTTKTHATLVDSPAIDGGDTNCINILGGTNNIDQRGESRPQDGNGDGTCRLQYWCL